MANTSDVNQAAASMTEASQKIVKALQKVTKVLEQLSKTTQRIERLEKQAKRLTEVLDKVDKQVKQLNTVFNKAEKQFKKLIQTVDKLYSQARGLDSVLRILTQSTIRLVRIVQIAAMIVAGFISVLRGFMAFTRVQRAGFAAVSMLSQIANVFRNLRTAIVPVLKNVFDAIGKGVQGMWRGAKTAAGWLSKTFKNIFSSKGNAAAAASNGQQGTSWLSKLKSVLSSLGTGIKTAAGSLTKAGGYILKGGPIGALLNKVGSNKEFMNLTGVLPKLWDFGKKAVESAGQQEMVKDRLIARTGSEATGTAIFDKFKGQAMKEGKDVNQTLAGVESFLPMTSNTNQISQLLNIGDRLALFDPAKQGTQAAYDAVKSAMEGDVKSLTSKYNISNPADTNKIESAAKKGDTEGVIRALEKLMEHQNMGQGAADKLKESPLAKMNTLKTNFQNAMNSVGLGALEALVPIFDKLNAAFQSGKFQPFFDLIQNGLYIGAQAMGQLVDAAFWLFDVIQSNWPMVQAFLIAAAAVLIPLLIAQIYSIAVAWLTANWPVLLIIAVLGLLIYILMECGMTTEQIVGSIVGAFYMLFTSIYNQVALIWNVIASFAEFFATVLFNPSYAIKKLIYDLAMTFGQFFYNIARSAEDFIGGMMETANEGIKGLNSFLSSIGFNKQLPLIDENNLHTASNKISSLLNQLDEPTTTGFSVSIPRMEQQNYKDSFDAGYSFGSDLVQGVSDLAGKFNPKVNDENIGFTKLNQSKAPVVDRVNTIGSIDDKVNVDSEDIRMMRDLAEMKNIQNFVALTPTVQVTTGDVRSGEDVDTIIKRIETHLEQQFVATAEGVYT